MHLVKLPFRGLVSLALLVTALGCCWSPARADQFPADPVETLKKVLVLSSPTSDPKELNEELRKAAEKLQSISDIARALDLREWPQQEERNAIDQAKLENQALLAERLQHKVRHILRTGSTSSQLATLTLVAELGARISVPENLNVRNLNKLSEGLTGVSPRSSTSRKGLGRALTGDLAYLVGHGDNERLRETAARTLGQVFPDPKVAVTALRPLLYSPRLGERRAAAAGLLSMVREVSRLTASSGTKGSEERINVNAMDWVDTCSQVIPAASAGLVDNDVEVRRQSAAAFERAAAGLMDQVKPEPPETGGERRAPPVRASSNELQPVLQAFSSREAATAMARATLDSDTEVRILSRRALEEIGSVRDRLLHPDQGPRAVPGPGSEETSQRSRQDTLLASAGGQALQPQEDGILQALRIALPALRQGVSDPVVAARLQAVEALETMGPAAAPAVPELIRALADPDRFVRWAAARALGKVGPEGAAAAVRPLGRLLHDQDLDVDLAAAAALERFGPVARGAVPQLLQALEASDADKRLAAIRTLTSIGTDARPAVPGLAAALSDPDLSVRRSAAELLGKFGPAAAAAEPALRRAMADPEPDMRQAASTTLLKVLQPSEPK